MDVERTSEEEAHVGIGLDGVSRRGGSRLVSRVGQLGGGLLVVEWRQKKQYSHIAGDKRR